LNTGDREIPPTGKKIELRAIQVVDVANDRVRSVRQYFDMGTLLQQIGADH
jgi:predicted ester cyclase